MPVKNDPGIKDDGWHFLSVNKNGGDMEKVRIFVNPGICGFDCKVVAETSGKRKARVEIAESGCAMIRQYSEDLPDLGLQDIFVPLTKNVIFIAAEKAGCHLACPVPVAVVKACEVVLGLAIPKDVFLRVEKR